LKEEAEEQGWGSSFLLTDLEQNLKIKRRKFERCSGTEIESFFKRFI